jgi:hypothetical protein
LVCFGTRLLWDNLFFFIGIFYLGF